MRTPEATLLLSWCGTEPWETVHPVSSFGGTHESHFFQQPSPYVEEELPPHYRRNPGRQRHGNGACSPCRSREREREKEASRYEADPRRHARVEWRFSCVRSRASQSFLYGSSRFGTRDDH